VLRINQGFPAYVRWEIILKGILGKQDVLEKYTELKILTYNGGMAMGCGISKK
jgi:hypothetical protein